jgi:hypothetical protein
LYRLVDLPAGEVFLMLPASIGGLKRAKDFETFSLTSSSKNALIGPKQMIQGDLPALVLESKTRWRLVHNALNNGRMKFLRRELLRRFAVPACEGKTAPNKQ